MPSPDDVYATFGRTAQIAQNLETELITLIMCVEAINNGWFVPGQTDSATSLLEKLHKDTLGRMLKRFNRMFGENQNLHVFDAALDARNRLMHGFFHRYGLAIFTELGRHQMMAELQESFATIHRAHEAASGMVKPALDRLKTLKDEHTRQRLTAALSQLFEGRKDQS